MINRIKAIIRGFTEQNIYYYLHSRRPNLKINADIFDWRSYIFLDSKYGKFIDELPRYERTGKIVKKIWWCWLQGEESAPLLCKACLASLRKHLTEYEIIVVDEDNMLSYADIPMYILDKYEKGIISKAHFSDILRTALLVKNGGVWIDSSVYCTGNGYQILEKPLFFFQDWKFNQELPLVASNWFIVAEKGHPILRTVWDILLHYWEKENTIINYLIYHIFLKIVVTRKYPASWKNVPLLSNIPPHILQFELFEHFDDKRWQQIVRMSDFHKLSWKDERCNEKQGNTFFTHLLKDM